jgi:hypothetical protein
MRDRVSGGLITHLFMSKSIGCSHHSTTNPNPREIIESNEPPGKTPIPQLPIKNKSNRDTCIK